MDSNMWLGAIRFLTALLYYILYPIFLLLRELWTLLDILLTPFTHLGVVILRVIWAPFRLFVRFEPLYLFLGWAVAIGGVTGLLLRITHQSLGQALEQSKSRRKARCKVERPPSLEQQTDEQSAMSTENHGSPSLGPHQSDGKASSRFSLSEFYTDWIDQDSPIASKDVDLISMTTIEEEDDYQDPAY